jgi:hypothetical protein
VLDLDGNPLPGASVGFYGRDNANGPKGSKRNVTAKKMANKLQRLFRNVPRGRKCSHCSHENAVVPLDMFGFLDMLPAGHSCWSVMSDQHTCTATAKAERLENCSNYSKELLPLFV